MMLLNINVFHYLILGLFLFVIGFLGLIVSKDFIKIIISLEIMINAVCINFVSISYFCDGIKLEGTAFCFFISIISFAQIACLISIMINFYQRKKAKDIDKINELKG